VGKKLIEEAAKFSRENNLKITPKCPYARKVMERSDKYKMSWPKSFWLSSYYRVRWGNFLSLFRKLINGVYYWDAKTNASGSICDPMGSGPKS
jgi:hypothetical protein